MACLAGTFVVMAAASGDGYLDSLTPLRGARTSDRISNFTSVGTAGFSPTQAPDSATLDLVAGCAPAAQLAGATSVATKVRVPSTGFTEAVASCPAGMRAFGGGGHLIRADNRYITRESAMFSNSVTRDGTGWSSAAGAFRRSTAWCWTRSSSACRVGDRVGIAGQACRDPVAEGLVTLDPVWRIGQYSARISKL